MRHLISKRKLGVTVREGRVERGWTQQKLAKKAGVHAQTIHLIENYRVNPHLSTLRDLSLALEMDLEETCKLQTCAQSAGGVA